MKATHRIKPKACTAYYKVQIMTFYFYFKMPDGDNLKDKPKSKSMFQEMTKPAPKKTPSTKRESMDKQKMIKWCLIIGVPVILIIVVIAVVISVFAGG